MYPKSHNSDGALLNTKVVPFKVLKRSIQFLIHLLFKKIHKTFGLVWTQNWAYFSSFLKISTWLYLKNLPLFSKMFFHDFGFESRLTKQKKKVPISDSYASSIKKMWARVQVTKSYLESSILTLESETLTTLVWTFGRHGSSNSWSRRLK